MRRTAIIILINAGLVLMAEMLHECPPEPEEPNTCEPCPECYCPACIEVDYG